MCSHKVKEVSTHRADRISATIHLLPGPNHCQGRVLCIMQIGKVGQES